MWYLIATLAVILALVDAQGFVLNDRPPQVIFSAGKTVRVNISSSEVIKYDEVFTNIGNGYDSATGIFLCPEEGVYWLSLYAIGKPFIDLQLIKNYEQLVSIWSYSGTHSTAGGNGIFVPLKQGEKVFVKSNKALELWGYEIYTYATFSGYKLPFV